MGAVIFALIDPSTPFGRRLAVTPFDKLRARLLSMPVGILYGEKVTMIKMDIEGYELKALMGAKQIIKEQKPKLAICAYHTFSHLWEIPLLIKSLNPDYKIYLRHHTNLDCETVCYAI